MIWKLADAKNRLSEVVNRALSQGPQWIRRRNDAFVVLSERDYLELTEDRMSFKQLLLDGPTLDGLELDRDASPMRDVDL